MSKSVKVVGFSAVGLPTLVASASFTINWFDRTGLLAKLVTAHLRRFLTTECSVFYTCTDFPKKVCGVNSSASCGRAPPVEFWPLK